MKLRLQARFREEYFSNSTQKKKNEIRNFLHQTMLMSIMTKLENVHISCQLLHLSILNQ